MRTIKFRGKDIGGAWVFGCLIKLWPDFWQIQNQADLGDLIVINPDTIGQFTGLLDRNGTEIYEGDIVKNRFDFPLEIKFKDGCFIAELTEDSSIGVNNIFEVIGNIHDDKHLLEAKDV
jgi:hypothetical protein